MYIIKTTSRDNVYIKDLNLVVYWNDPDGVAIEKHKFDNSKDAKAALDKNQIYITRIDGDYSEVPDKNVVDDEQKLQQITDVYQDMLVYIRNYMGSGSPVLAMYDMEIAGWKFLSTVGNSGSGSGSTYVHPLTHPATMIVQDANHRFVSDMQIESWNDKPDRKDFSNVAFSGDYNDLKNKPSSTSSTPTNLAKVATSGDYDDLINKPTLSNVAASGDYNDLINKPTIPDLSQLPTVATTGDYNDLINKPNIPTVPTLAAVATSGEYNDLMNKPVIPQNSSDLNLDNVYTKSEVNNKIASININPSSILKYEPQGSTNGECFVTATGTGIEVVKTGNKIAITKPDGVDILSIQLHFTDVDVKDSCSVEIDYNASASNSYDPINFEMPHVQVINDVDGSRAMRVNMSANYNVNSHTVQITGLLANVAVWVKLVF